MTPGELIVEFMDLISDRNSQTGNPYLYVMPLPGMVVIDGQRRRVITPDFLRTFGFRV